MTQRELRMHTFCVLFGADLAGEKSYDQCAVRYLECLSDPDPDELEERGLKTVPDMDEGQKGRFCARLADIEAHIPELDRAVSSAAEGWTLERMARTEKIILRLGAYEMLFDDEIPVKVAINEAVELAKIYGGAKSPSFVNGVLAKLVT